MIPLTKLPLTIPAFSAALLTWLPAEGAAHRQDSLPPDVVTLTFAWPSPFRATVDGLRYQIRTTNGEGDSTFAEFAYEMVAEPHTQGLVVRSIGFRTAATLDSADEASLQAFAEQVQAMNPAMIVNATGDLVDISGIESVQAFLNNLMAAMADSLPAEAQPQFREFVQQATSREVLTARSAEEWNAIVGTWTGAEFELGALYENRVDEPLPIMPDQTVPFIYEFAAVERVPCVEGSQDTSCVVLEMTSYPDPEQMTQILEQFVERLTSGMNAPAMAYEELSVTNFVQLITEPTTLVPHWVTVVQTIEGVVVVPGEGRTQFEQTRGRELTFTYSPPR